MRFPDDAGTDWLGQHLTEHVGTVEDQTDYFAVMQDPEGNEFCNCQRCAEPADFAAALDGTPPRGGSSTAGSADTSPDAAVNVELTANRSSTYG
jgi:hypothetical protein